MSIYNDIYIRETSKTIVIDCSPDQYSRDVIYIDKEDYNEIEELANKLGWNDEVT